WRRARECEHRDDLQGCHAVRVPANCGDGHHVCLPRGCYLAAAGTLQLSAMGRAPTGLGAIRTFADREFGSVPAAGCGEVKRKGPGLLPSLSACACSPIRDGSTAREPG